MDLEVQVGHRELGVARLADVADDRSGGDAAEGRPSIEVRVVVLVAVGAGQLDRVAPERVHLRLGETVDHGNDGKALVADHVDAQVTAAAAAGRTPRVAEPDGALHGTQPPVEAEVAGRRAGLAADADGAGLTTAA